MKNGVSYVDLELKEFEDKINSITEQFMSLLNSEEPVESSVGNKYNNTATIYKNETTNESSYNNITGPTIFNENSNGITFKLSTDDINIGGIPYGKQTFDSGLPKHAVKFDSVEQMELNNKLESLYDTKKTTATSLYDEKPTIAFSDSNIGRINSLGNNNIYDNYTKDETNSTLNNKEVYEMSNYYGEGCTGESTTTGNVFHDYATIPAEKALVEKKSWLDTLFMDIPWDTKIDIWGGIKKFCKAQVKITF